MSASTEKFRGHLPASWKPVYEILAQGNFIPTLVGGSVRDFLITGNVGTDWDLELTHPTVVFTKDLWKQLGKDLHALGKTTFLPYDIIRLEIGKHQYEFSAPRVETFSDGNHHKNFDAEFDLRAPFEKAVMRRDFTINAMGFRFHSDKNIELLDPLEGLRHLRDKVLYPCGKDFSKDPVRFLRALRFAHKLNFDLSDELEIILQDMDVTGYSSAYLWNEMQKSADPIGYYEELLEWLPVHPEMKLPVGPELLPKIEDLKNVLLDPSYHEEWMIALEWVGISCESWQSYFSLSSETGRRLGRWAEASRKFTTMMPEIFHGEFDEVREKSEFEMVFDWFFTTKQLLQKNPELPLLSMIEKYLPDWIHLYRFEVVKDVKHIDPPLLGQIPGLEFMSAVIVSIFSPQDLDQVREIFFESSTKKSFADEEEKRAFEWKYLGSYLKRFPELAYVAKRENRVLGYVIGSTASDFEIQPHLAAFNDLLTKYSAHLHINCHAESRGLGVGSLLIKKLEEELQALNCNGLHIMTGLDSRNRSFYQKLGFSFEVVRNFQERPILMMGKTLTSLVSHT